MQVPTSIIKFSLLGNKKYAPITLAILSRPNVVNEPYLIEAGLIAQEIFAINDLSYTVTKGNTTKPYI